MRGFCRSGQSGLGPDDDAFISRQSEVFLAEVAKTLDSARPPCRNRGERALALRLLDAVLHAHALAEPAIRAGVLPRAHGATIKQIEETRVSEGMQIWKLYNHGFVARTPSITVGFDLFRGPARFRWDGPDGRKAVDAPGFRWPTRWRPAGGPVRCAVHQPRASRPCRPYVAEAFLKRGKPVVAPDSALSGTPLHSEITHLKREADTVKRFPFRTARSSYSS